MSAERKSYALYKNQVALGADEVVATIAAASGGVMYVKYGGHVSIQCLIARADGITAPSDTPAGAWEAYASVDGVKWTRVVTTAITTELALIAPNGNNVVDAWATFNNFPGIYLLLRYKRTSGGGTNAVATMHVATW